MRTLISVFRPGSVYSGSASWEDCDRMFLRNSVWARFLIGCYTMPEQRYSLPAPTSLDQGCMRVLGVTCHLRFWQNDRGSLKCLFGNTGLECTPNKSQHTKLTGEENSSAAPAGTWNRNLSITSPALYQQAIATPTSMDTATSYCQWKCSVKKKKKKREEKKRVFPVFIFRIKRCMVMYFNTTMLESMLQATPHRSSPTTTSTFPLAFRFFSRFKP